MPRYGGSAPPWSLKNLAILLDNPYPLVYRAFGKKGSKMRPLLETPENQYARLYTTPGGPRGVFFRIRKKAPAEIPEPGLKKYHFWHPCKAIFRE